MKKFILLSFLLGAVLVQKVYAAPPEEQPGHMCIYQNNSEAPVKEQIQAQCLKDCYGLQTAKAECNTEQSRRLCDEYGKWKYTCSCICNPK